MLQMLVVSHTVVTIDSTNTPIAMSMLSGASNRVADRNGDRSRRIGSLMFSIMLWLAALTSSTGATFVDSEYIIDSWETEQSLPENSATAMVQTHDGYLWFGTFNGLVRFDGVKLTVFDPSNTPGLPSGEIINLHLDKRERMWVSTTRGLAIREGGKWRNFGATNGWVGNFVRTFTERTNGDLLISDVVMPREMSGIQLSELLLQKKPALKVILMSGYSAEMVQHGLPQKKGMVVLQKPFELAVLSRTVRDCLDRG